MGWWSSACSTPKAGRDDPMDVSRVQRAVDARKIVFPIAIDWDRRNNTLKDWWLKGWLGRAFLLGCASLC